MTTKIERATIFSTPLVGRLYAGFGAGEVNANIFKNIEAETARQEENIEITVPTTSHPKRKEERGGPGG